ncbi:hypothetical protein [Pseudomonas fluorescens]|nr:hypothetical protein [Pseudomonas fluorescens]
MFTLIITFMALCFYAVFVFPQRIAQQVIGGEARAPRLTSLLAPLPGTT